MLRHFAALAILGATLAGSAVGQVARSYADAQIYTLEHGGRHRQFALYAPRRLPTNQPAPLIIALHGRFSSGKALHALSGLAALADANGAVIAYPQAVGGFWHDGGHPGLRARDQPEGDASFIRTLIAELSQARAIDADRIYLVGFDQGGPMAFRLACDPEFHFAGVAVVGALMWSYSPQSCARATPMLIVHGRRDPLYPVEGGAVSEAEAAPRRLSVADTIAFWRGVNGCTGGETATERSGSVYYRQCTGARLAYAGVDRGGGSWFRADGERRLSRANVSVADVIGSFFLSPDAFALPRLSAGNDRARSYIVYVPPRYDASRPTPVVVALHGRPSNSAGMASISGLNDVADRQGFIVVYPDGVNNEWNVLGDLLHMEDQYPQDDVAFISRVVDEVGLDLNIDPTRRYLTGFSNGGFMTMRVACSAPNSFAAFAIVGALLYLDMRDECRGNPPAPMLFVSGSSDPSIPFDGVVMRSEGEARRVSLSAQETVGYFIRRNNCDAQAERRDIPATGGPAGVQVLRFDQVGCDDEADVRFYLINGGGHQWPGVEPGLPEDAFGPISMDINAGEEIWDFFSRHTARQRR